MGCSAKSWAGGPGHSRARLSPRPSRAAWEARSSHVCPGPGRPARQRRLSAGSPGPAGRTMRPFTPGGSGGGWRPPWGAWLAPGPTLHCSRFGSSRNCHLQLPSGKLLRRDIHICHVAPTHGGQPRSLCLSTLSQNGGPVTPIKWWPPHHQNGEHGERAMSLLSLDTLPGSPAARQAQRETVATKNNPSSV